MATPTPTLTPTSAPFGVDGPPVLVVGAGLAGLRCAQRLAAAGLPVRVFEAADRPGGRVRTDVTAEGFRLDRGFQVLFTAYPAVRRAIDLRRLNLGQFDNGAAVVTPKGPEFLRPPLQHPSHVLSAVTSPLLTWGDRVRLAATAAAAALAPWDGVREVRGVPRTVAEEIAALGFSPRLAAQFLRPFLAGVLLDPTLSASGDVFQFVLKMLALGRAALPAEGMQALPDALGALLPPGSLRLGAPVAELLRAAELGAVRGVRLASGETVDGSAVVVATDGEAAGALTRLTVAPRQHGGTTVYLAGRERLYRQRLLALNALPEAYVNHAALLTNVVPSYAPAGWHLLSATVLGPTPEPDDVVEERVRQDLQRWFPRVNLRPWRTLGIVRVPRAQRRQPPGFTTNLPGPRTATPGLYLAGSCVEDESLNGALRSGEQAADAVAADLAAPGTLTHASLF